MKHWLKWAMGVIGAILLAIIIEVISRYLLPPTADEAGTILLTGYQRLESWLAAPSGSSNGMVALLVIGIVCLTTLAWVLYRRSQTEASVALPIPKPFELNDLQLAVLSRFWQLQPGKRESAASLADNLGHTGNEVAHALDALFDKGLVSDSLDQLTGRSFFLNEAGRKSCAERLGK